ncbi:MAG: glycosyltransferase family 4 protein [Rhodocyclaceae bacterium]|nr:glycosyltransferase family 4 protein [Rhodocyclaceae bacterium]
MSRPKLLFLVTEDWYFVSHRLPLGIAARDAGFEVVVAAHEGSHGQIIRDAGLTFIPIAISRRGGNPLAEISRLSALYRNERPAIVHHVALKPILYGSLAARLAGVPRIVNSVAGLGWLFTSGGLVARTVRPIIRRIIGRLLAAPGSRTIVQNPDDKALLMRSGVPEDRLHLVRGAGVNTDMFLPTEEPVLPVTVILAARMLWNKGVGEFVAAAKHLHDEGLPARFVLVGDPDPANPASVPDATLRAWHARDGIEWWGRCEHMPAVLKQAHVACLPSYREGLPKSLLEAAACGLPIVTTDTPGCREVVTDGDNGFLVPVKDTRLLTAALKKLILDTGLRRRMGERSRARALTEFSQERVIGETLAVYRELMG